MHKLKAALAGMSVSLVCAGMLLLSGCGSGDAQADHDAQAKIQAADQQRAAADTPDKLDQIQKIYDDLASGSGLSKQMQILVHGRQAQLRLERISMLAADLRTQELNIGRDIVDIQSLGMQVAGAQSSVDALKSYDPGTGIDRLKKEAAQIAGSADQLTWIMPNPSQDDPNGSVSSPTLFAVNQEIESLGTKIQQANADLDACHKLSAAKADDAETFLRRAEGEAGDQQVNDSTTAAVDRRDAALADAKAATLTNDLARMKANLDRATEQASALQDTVKSFNDQIQSQQTRWASITDQIKAQQQVQQSLIGDDAAASPSTIAGLARDLAAKLQNAAATREKVNSEINTVAQQLNVTIAECNQIRGDVLRNVGMKPDDPDVIIWKQSLETLHPAYFNLQLASALEMRASVAAEKARIDRQLFFLFNDNEISAADAAKHFRSLNVAAAQGTIKIPGINTVLDSKKTGVSMPKAFGDIQPPQTFDDLKQAKDDVDKAFQEAVDAYDSQKFGATDMGPAADQRRNISLMSGAQVNREWADFAAIEGDSADEQTHRQAATDLEGQIDPNFALAAAGAPAPHPPAAAQ